MGFLGVSWAAPAGGASLSAIIRLFGRVGNLSGVSLARRR